MINVSDDTHFLPPPKDVVDGIVGRTPQLTAGRRAARSHREIFGGQSCSRCGAIIDLALSVTNFQANPTGVAAELGMKTLATLQNIDYRISQAVKSAVAAIENAFNAFVDWISEHVRSLARTVLGQHGVSPSSMDGVPVLSKAMNEADAKVSRDGEVSGSTKNKVVAALLGDLLSATLILVMAIDAILIATKVLTADMAFVVGLVISIIATVIIVEIMKSAMVTTTGGQAYPFSIYDTSVSLGTAMGMDDPHAHDALFWICAILDTIVIGSLSTIVAAALGQVDLLLAIMALSLGLYSFINSDKITGLLAIAMAAASLLTTVGEYALSKFLRSPFENKELKIMSIILDGTSIGLAAMVNQIDS